MSGEKSTSAKTKLLVGGYFVLLVNSSYLAAYADPTLFSFGNVALPPALRLVRTVAFLPFALQRFPSFSAPLKLASLLLRLRAALCVFMVWFGATRPYRWPLCSPSACAAAGSSLLLLVFVE